MLHHKHEGKILHRDFERKRNQGLKDWEAVGDYYDFLDLEFPDGYGKHNDLTYEIRSRLNKIIDIRKRKGLGETEDESI
jgi:hypothetical protein